MPHALQPWASLRSYGIWMRTSCTSSKPAVIVCLNDVAHACTRLLRRPYHRRRNARTAALSALLQRAHAIAYVDCEAVHYAHTRAIVTTLEGVRSPSVLRTVARCCSADRAAKMCGAERFRMRLCSWRRGRTILRSCDTPPRDRCLCVRFSVQCSAVHAYLPACGGGDTCRRPRHRLYHRRRNARREALAALNVNPPGS